MLKLKPIHFANQAVQDLDDQFFGLDFDLRVAESSIMEEHPGIEDSTTIPHATYRQLLDRISELESENLELQKQRTNLLLLA